MQRLVSILVCSVFLACSDSSGPEAESDPILNVAFVDDDAQLTVVRTGRGPVATAVHNVIPFAAASGAVAYFTAGGLKLYHLDGRVDSLPVPFSGAQTSGAISPDGSQLAYVNRGTRGQVFLHVIHIVTGQRDSIDTANRLDEPAASQIIFSTPVFSPTGDRIAFLLPNSLTVQLFLYEISTRRIEVFPVRVSVTLFAKVVAGWPRWTPDGSIRFLAWRLENGSLGDTLAVMRIFPESRDRQSEVIFAATPESLDIEGVGPYSFNARGDAVAFAMQSGGHVGIFSMSARSPHIRTLLFEPSTSPRYPLLIP